jgi:hypothetical protein
MDINRGVIIVRPKQPYVDWANTCDDEPTSTTLGAAREDCSAYLLPCWEDGEQLELLLERFSRRIFENELSGWTTNEACWPKQRDLSALREWFEIEPHSMVFELGDGHIRIEGG